MVELLAIVILVCWAIRGVLKIFGMVGEHLSWEEQLRQHVAANERYLKEHPDAFNWDDNNRG